MILKIPLPKHQHTMSENMEESKTQTNQLLLMSFGYSHGVPGIITHRINARGISNPPSNARKGHTGLDRRFRTEVLAMDGAEEVVMQVVNTAVDLLENRIDTSIVDVVGVIGVGCEQGRHRSVSVVIEAKNRLEKLGYDSQQIITDHRDVHDYERKKSKKHDRKKKFAKKITGLY